MAISTIQARRGMMKDFDPDKMLPGEWAVSTDPETENQIIWMCFRAGVVRRIGTYEDALEKGAQALAAAIESQKYALESKSYAIGEGGVRPNEATDSSKYYYEKAQEIVRELSGALVAMGTIEAGMLEQQEKKPGYMYNISDSFITDSRFKEGAGHAYPAGTNVYRTADGFWDCLAGTMVAGVKGDAETEFRTGDVNLTAEDIGVGGNGLVPYPKEGVISIPATGETTGQIVITLPDEYTKGDILMFNLFIGFESNSVHGNIKYRVVGKMESDIQWLDGIATSIEFGVNYPARFGYSRSKDKAAVAIGDADSSWNGAEVLITEYYCRNKEYAAGSEGWSVSISETDFVENVANNWGTRISQRSNMFDMLQNYTSASSGNLLEGTLFKPTDFYGDGIKKKRTWSWYPYINFYNVDPFDGMNAVGVYLNAERTSFGLYTDNDNNPIKRVGKAYKFSIWMRATVDIPRVTIMINKSYGVSKQVDVTTEWKLYEVKTDRITTIAPNEHVIINGLINEENASQFIYFYCPKLEVIEEVSVGNVVDIEGASIEFSEAATRANLLSGDSLATLFGKQKKWNADIEGGLMPYVRIGNLTYDVSNKNDTLNKLDNVELLFGASIEPYCILFNDKVGDSCFGGGLTCIYGYTTSGGLYGVQLAILYGSNSGMIKIRRTRDKVWTDWCNVYNDMFKPTPTQIGAPSIGVIPANTDLNTLKTPGFYTSQTDAVTATLKNAPTGTTFGLIVSQTVGVSVDNLQGVTQRAITYLTNSPKIYFRNFYTGSGTPVWGEWQREYTTVDKPAPADIGAVNKAGDTMTGYLKLEKVGVDILTDGISGVFARGMMFHDGGAIRGGIGAFGNAGVATHLYMSMGTSSPWASDKGLMIGADYIRWKGKDLETKGTVVNATLPTDGWTGTEAPFTLTVTKSEVKADSIINIDVASAVTSEQLDAFVNAKIVDGGQSNGSFILKAFGEKPAVPIPIKIEIR